MFCSKCGSRLPEGACFCNQCGKPVTSPKAQVKAPTAPSAPVFPASPVVPVAPVEKTVPAERNVPVESETPAKVEAPAPNVVPATNVVSTETEPPAPAASVPPSVSPSVAPAIEKKSTLWIKVLVVCVVCALLIAGGIWKGGDIVAFVKSLFGPSVNDFYQKKFEYTMVVDARDKQKYHEIKIGNQVWIAQNMNFTTENSVCDSCGLYGRLYTHEDALNVCPAGYVLPSFWDYMTLDKNLNGEKNWFSVKGVAGGLDSYGFASVPSGFRSIKDGSVKRRGIMAGYWLADYDRDNALRVKVDDEYGKTSVDGLSRDYGFAVRCIKRESSVRNKDKAVLIDGRNAKYYRTATIGGARWMVQNLEYKTKKSKCFGDEDEMCKALGRYYTWDEAQMVCPSGWHLPTKAEVDSLLKAVGGKESAGWVLMAQDDMTEVDAGPEAFRFSAVPAGFYNAKEDSYREVKLTSYFWTSSAKNLTNAYALSLDNRSKAASIDVTPKANGMPIRCVEGEPEFGVMVDSRDKKKYKFAKIGEQVWMAENLNYKTKLGEGTGRNVCYSSLHGQHAFLYEDAVEACPDGWHLPSDGEWYELFDFAKDKCGNVTVSECLAKGVWGAWESDVCCAENENGECMWNEKGMVPDNECARRMGIRIVGKNKIGFAAVGFLQEDFVLGSGCREGCGGPSDGKGIANFWSSSRRIVTIDLTESLPLMRQFQDPEYGADDCSDGFGNYSTRTEFSLRNVGKTVASIRCVRD